MMQATTAMSLAISPVMTSFPVSSRFPTTSQRLRRVEAPVARGSRGTPRIRLEMFSRRRAGDHAGISRKAGPCVAPGRGVRRATNPVDDRTRKAEKRLVSMAAPGASPGERVPLYGVSGTPFPLWVSIEDHHESLDGMSRAASGRPVVFFGSKRCNPHHARRCHI
jgi:hypothetical protein